MTEIFLPLSLPVSQAPEASKISRRCHRPVTYLMFQKGIRTFECCPDQTNVRFGHRFGMARESLHNASCKLPDWFGKSDALTHRGPSKRKRLERNRGLLGGSP